VRWSPPQKKIEHPFVKETVGTWDFGGDMKGASTVRLALGGTAVVEDLESTMGPAPYYGHGVRKLSDDGKTMTLWWFDNFSPAPEVFHGPVSADGYELRSEKHRVVMKKTASGLQFQMFEGDKLLFTSQYGRKGK
jgi:hypothetical protein